MSLRASHIDFFRSSCNNAGPITSSSVILVELLVTVMQNTSQLVRTLGMDGVAAVRAIHEDSPARSGGGEEACYKIHLEIPIIKVYLAPIIIFFIPSNLQTITSSSSSTV